MGGSCLFWKKDHAEFCRLGTNSAITAKSSTVLALFLPQRRKPRKCASRFSVHVAPKKAAAFLDTRRRPSPSTSRRFLQRKEPDCSDCETSRFFEDELRYSGLVRPVVRGVGVRAGGWSVVIAAIVVRPMVILRISNPSGIARARGCAERGVSL